MRIIILLLLIVPPFDLRGYQAGSQSKPSDIQALNQKADQTEVKNPVPEKTRNCSPVEEKWWNEVRDKGLRVASLVRQENLLFWEHYKLAQAQPSSSAELIQLEARHDNALKQIASERLEFQKVIKRGLDNNYAVPVEDSKIIIINAARPNYTKQAVDSHIIGSVKVQCQFHENGQASDCHVVTGLGYGLDESALEALSRMVFLPVIAGGHFVTKTLRMSVSFSLD